MKRLLSLLLVTIAVLLPAKLWAADGAAEPYAVLSADSLTVTFYYDDQKAARGGMDINNSYIINNNSRPPYGSATTAVFDASFADFRPTSTAYWFVHCFSLSSITGLENLNTANVTNMTGMFRNCSSLTNLDLSSFNTQNVTYMTEMFTGCSGLTSLDVSHFNTQNVTNMVGMFSDCSSLTSLDVSHFYTQNLIGVRSMFFGCSSLTSLDVTGFNTDKVTNMGEMFGKCSGLTSLDLSNFNTQNVTNMENMFTQCSGLTSLDLSSFNTQNVTTMRYMFHICTNLTTIYVGSGWSTEAVTEGNYMFTSCSNLKGGAGTTYDSNHTDYTYAHIDGGTANPGYFTDKNATPVGNAEPYAVLSDDNTVLTFYYDDQKESRNGMSVGPFDLPQSRGWYEAKDFITSVVFDDSFADCRTITSTAYWFDQCFNLISISGLQFLNTSNVTDMDGMFWECSSLSALDLSNFNTSNVTNMNFMFASCTALTTLDVSNFDVSNVMYMNSMFQNCSGLTTLDLSHFETSNVSVMPGMFADCSSLTSLDLSSFNTANVRNMESMFNRCSALTTIYVGADWTTAAVTETSNNMFYGCTNLVGGQGTAFDANHTDYTYAHIDGGTANPGYFTDKNATPAVVEPYVVLSTNDTVIDEQNGNTTYGSTLTFYYDDQMSARQGTIMPMGEGGSATWSNYAVGITSVVFDPSFANCTTITNTSNWFSGFSRLTDISGLSYLNTANVTNMHSMFHRCTVLTSLDLSNFNTANVTIMQDMFSSSPALISLDLSSFNTANVMDMQEMFYNCQGLTALDLSSFNTANVTDMSSMFGQCKALTSLNVSSFNTANVTDLNEMFRDCVALTSVDISNFNTANVTDMGQMFDGCSSLVTIYVGNEWSTNSVQSGNRMFNLCENLVGGAGTTYDADHIDYTYAHIDGGTANPGYFTDKNATPAVVEPYAVLNDNNTVLTFYYDDQKEARSGMSVGPFTDYGQNGWRSLNVTKVVFDQTFANCRPTSTAFWFDGLYFLNEIEGIENLNTDNVTDMRSMFEACSSLTSIDFSHFNTENVTSFDHMFWNCTSLTNLDLSSFNTQKVTSTYWMFALCNRLTSVNLNGFNTSSMETMEGMFYDCASLAAIQAGSAAIPDSIYAQVNNPNLLVYVNEASLAPSNVQNVVVNGTAREIVLTDATSGNNNFYVPQTFTAERISYTRNFMQSTQVGMSRGWESIALPFDVQTITHETKGVIAPFGNTASNRHFWLRELGSNGLQPATGIAANTPYVISMPNSSDYTDSYNLAGRVTFAAENTQVPVTEVKASAMADESIVMIPTMQRQDRSSAVWALNVGEVRGRYLEGSVFERDYREVRPFEAYTVHREENSQPAPRYVPLQEIGGTTGINVMEDVRSKKDDVWYTTDGRKLQGKPSEKGVYINNGQKIVIR